jgi:hypothetical protein
MLRKEKTSQTINTMRGYFLLVWKEDEKVKMSMSVWQER